MCTVSSHEDDDYEVDDNESITLIMQSYINDLLKKLNDMVKTRFEKNEKLAKLSEKSLRDYMDQQFTDLTQKVQIASKQVESVKEKINEAIKTEKEEEQAEMEEVDPLAQTYVRLQDLEGFIEDENKNQANQLKTTASTIKEAFKKEDKADQVQNARKDAMNARI